MPPRLDPENDRAEPRATEKRDWRLSARAPGRAGANPVAEAVAVAVDQWLVERPPERRSTVDVPFRPDHDFRHSRVVAPSRDQRPFP